MNSYKPVIIIGNGLRNNPQLVRALCNLNIPVLTTWTGCDLVTEDDPAFCGRPGILGQRAANIIQQKATHLYCLGARLDGEQVAYDYDRFAPNAIKVIFDIDQAELDKLPNNWLKFKEITMLPEIGDDDWFAWCKALYARFRYEFDDTHSGEYVDMFEFMRLLSEYSNPDDVFAISSSGQVPCSFYQSFKIQQGQRVTGVTTLGAMGADIPMALGAALATGRRVICPTGDGGFMLNTQELETIHRLNLPIIFFVFNNNGYGSIRGMQDLRFGGHHVGCDPASGMTLPSFLGIAEAYKIPYMQMWGQDIKYFSQYFNTSPMIVEVFIDPDWREMPRVMASTVNGTLRTDDMENMQPYIDDLAELMK